MTNAYVIYLCEVSGTYFLDIADSYTTAINYTKQYVQKYDGNYKLAKYTQNDNVTNITYVNDLLYQISFTIKCKHIITEDNRR